MHIIPLSADQLVARIVNPGVAVNLCILDSCGVGHLGSHLLIAGVEPIETLTMYDNEPEAVLDTLNDKLTGNKAAIFTLSYDLGIRMQGISHVRRPSVKSLEPDAYIALFDCLVIHDYDSKTTYLTGDETRFAGIEKKLMEAASFLPKTPAGNLTAHSNFTKSDYQTAIETIKERIRCGDTYQTNLTLQLTVDLPPDTVPAEIFLRLRKDHPAPFAAFIQRGDSTVISASPERFIKIEGSTIEASPVKGTRPRGNDLAEDEALRKELLSSPKDIAENTMIVDLLRNDLGRVCEFGSVEVEKLCDLEKHPTLFHLVSTIKGKLRKDASVSDIIRAVFPCGSITGAPKIRTMQIIEELETVNRGLSMGAIGVSWSGVWSRESGAETSDSRLATQDSRLDLSVAIRTMVVKDQKAVFNVGGGIVIDSDPEKEYEETLLKAKALLNALGAKL